MKEIKGITDNPKQQLSFQVNDGNVVNMKLYFLENEIGWFFDIEYEGTSSLCHRLTNAPNIIRECRNIFPFGIGCSVIDGQEPYFADDFTSGRAILYALDKEDVEYVEKTVYGKIF